MEAMRPDVLVNPGSRGVGCCALGGIDVALREIPTGAAILFRPGWGYPALLEQNSVPLNVVFVVQEDAGTGTLRFPQFVGELVIEKAPDAVSKRFVF